MKDNAAINRAWRETTMIEVAGMTAEQIATQFKCSRTTAWRASRRGYLHPAYHAKKVSLDPIRTEKIEEAPKIQPPDKGIRNLNALHSYEQCKNIAQDVYKEFKIASVSSFEDYWDYAWDYILGSQSDNLNFGAFARATFRNAGFQFIRKRRLSANIKKGIWECNATVDGVEILNAEEVANFCRQQIIAKHGICAWSKVWTWAMAKKTYKVPSDIRNYLDIFGFDNTPQQ